MPKPTPKTPLPFRDPDLPIPERVADLIGRLSLEEKTSQMVNESPAIERLGIPAYNWWNECLHGVARAGRATVFPQAIGMAASFNDALLECVAEAISDEARAKHHQALRQGNNGIYFGLTCWSPNINIFRDPRWGRGQETYGEDPCLTGRMGTSFVRGLQGDEPKRLKVVATPKHFAVHSGPESLRHEFDARVNNRDLHETYLRAFRECVQQGRAASIMGAYNRTNGEPCCGSKTLLQDILRERWGFDGYVVSDCGAICDFHKNHKLTADPPESAAMAVRNGCDLNCGGVFGALPEAAARGLVSEQEIDTALTRLFTARFKLGMFDPPEADPYASLPVEVVGCELHEVLALQMARESIVLLKNEGDVLPLSKEMRSLQIVGPHADSRAVLLGNYYGHAANLTTIVDGIMGAVSVGTQVWFNNHAGGGIDLRSATAYAGWSDLTIAVIGTTPAQEGEEGEVANSDGGGDRSRIDLSDDQKELLDALLEVGKPVVAVLTGGSPVALGEYAERLDAVVLAWYPGQAGGQAVAEVLFGDFNPGGRLPVTFVKELDQLPDLADYSMSGRTYRFMHDEPLYRFGYGLSYTRFEYSNIRTDADQVVPDDPLTVSVDVRNAGKLAGDEVLQLYVHDVEASVPVPRLHLEGFRRIHLGAGEKATVRFRIDPIQFAAYDDNGEPFLEAGTFEISVGGGQPDDPMLPSITTTVEAPATAPLKETTPDNAAKPPGESSNG